MIKYNKTWVSIANEALARIGDAQIDSLDSLENSAMFCNKLLPSAISMVFGSHNWNCSKKRVSLSMMSEVPAFGYGYTFKLPNDFSKSVSTSCFDFQIESDKLLTNDSFVNMVYIALPEDATTINPPILRSALVLCLAYLLATPLLGNTQTSNQLYNEFMVTLNNAKIQNDAKDIEEVFGETPLWIEQR